MKKTTYSKLIYLLLVCLSLALASTLSLISCADNLCRINLDYIRYYPYPDFAENISGAMNISKNQLFGLDFAHPHAPGIYILTGLFYKILGISGLVQSPVSMIVWIYASVFGLCLMISAVYSAVYGFRYGLIVFVIIVLLGYKQNLTYIMSETVAFWLAIPLTTLCIRYAAERGLAARSKLLFCIPIIIAFCGIGFPAIVCMPILILIYKLYQDREGGYKPLMTSLIPGALAIGMVFCLLMIYTDVSSLRYWMVDVNKTVGQQLLKNVYSNLRAIGGQMYLFEILLLLPIQFLILLASYRRNLITKPVLIILLLCCIGGLWRVSFGYKALPNASIAIGVLMEFKKDKIFKDVKNIYFLAVLCFLLLINNLFASNVLTAKAIENPDAIFFDDPEMCRLTSQSSSNCKCVEVLVFGPQIFIQNDIKQCKNQMNTWADAMGEDDRYFNVVKNNILNNEAIYLVPPKQFINQDSRLESLVGLIHKNYKCKNVKQEWQVCK